MYIIIIAIILIVVFTIKPLRINKFNLDMISTPIVIFILLYLFKFIPNDTIIEGIVGYKSLKPWEILIIFYSVAYVSISVDLSGILDYFSYKIVKYAKGKGVLLFTLIYLFACLLTVFTSNDIVILTLTPIIFYLKKHANINIIPLLFAEFFGANTASMFLYIGNPTNIIIANSLNIPFNEYSRIMYIPSITATLCNYVILLLFFKNKITKKYYLNQKSYIKLRSIYDAIISLLLLITMLIILLFSDSLHLKIWQITLFFALIYFLEDIIIWISYTAKNSQLYKTEISNDLKKSFSFFGFYGERNDFIVIFKRMPWKLLPFIIVNFILISSLKKYGLINTLSQNLSIISDSLFINIIIYGFSGFILTNLINNQPMSILFSNILLNESNNLSNIVYYASAYAVIIASNLGANLSLIGSLAGLMWEKILKIKNLRINYIVFLKVGLSITLIVFTLTLITLYFVIKFLN
ncbi:MAG: ArsB/NhaD family transporter [Candidatus Cloacimonetes bacterium]|jgi:arsenical pump membrane protein|nr:SLC13 family permease [Candidatus Cloacimonadota bacterium]MDD4155329.1 ArsB/NhaD family transporter [Candidatus Cloacimonadota bacterium]